MYRLLIVDDEMHVIEGVISDLNLEKMKYLSSTRRTT